MTGVPYPIKQLYDLIWRCCVSVVPSQHNSLQMQLLTIFSVINTLHLLIALLFLKTLQCNTLNIMNGSQTSDTECELQEKNRRTQTPNFMQKFNSKCVGLLRLTDR